MDGIFSRKFHRQTDFDFPIGSEPPDPQYWPKEWTEIRHKEYVRFPKTELSKNILPLGELEKALKKRSSSREYDTKAELSFEELSTLLCYSAGVRTAGKSKSESVRRFYPSGGARYPLEIYLGIQRVQGMQPGIYHYNVKGNLLETLTTNPDDLESLREGLYYSWSREAAVILFITAVWNRNMMKYRDRGYRIILMEAGHLAQNFSLISSALGIGCCNSVGFHNGRINEVLDIEEEDEDSLYMALIGKTKIS